MASQTKYCQNCGAQIDIKAEICPKCGVRVAPPPQQTVMQVMDRKSAGLAAVLSFFIPGLGQIYNGQIGKGIVMIILAVVIGATVILVIGLILYPIYWIWGMYDAYSTANKINAGLIRS